MVKEKNMIMVKLIFEGKYFYGKRNGKGKNMIMGN